MERPEEEVQEIHEGDSFTLPEPDSGAPDPLTDESAEALTAGEIVYASGNRAPYRVEYVNESRAWCVPVRWTGEEFVKAQGKGVNISPRAFVERVDPGQLDGSSRRVQRRPRPVTDTDIGGVMPSVAAIPAAGKSNKQINKDNKAKIAARKSADRAAGIGVKGGTGRMVAAKSKSAKPPKTVRKCACSCGEETMSYFAPGHDGRWHGWVAKLADGRLTPEDLSAQQRKSLGALKKAGKGWAPVLNYKGEKYVASH